jgi:hypothetical protein
MPTESMLRTMRKERHRQAESQENKRQGIIRM